VIDSPPRVHDQNDAVAARLLKAQQALEEERRKEAAAADAADPSSTRAQR
jgi:hypothetical protein